MIRPEKWRPDPALLVLFCLYFLLLTAKMGAISPTYDESVDLTIIDCLARAANSFECGSNMSQMRLPYYIHILVLNLLKPSEPLVIHYWISALFMLFSLVLTYSLALRIFDISTARLAAAFFCLSAPLLCSGRMLLSHSNSIFVFFTLLTFLLWTRFVGKPSFLNFTLSSVSFGLSAASSLSGGLSIVHLVIFAFLARRHCRYGHAFSVLTAWAVLAVIVFEASTIVFLRPENLQWAWKEINAAPPGWNYMGLKTGNSPWWFSFCLLFIKINPFLGLCFILSLSVGLSRNTGWQQAFIYSTFSYFLFLSLFKYLMLEYEAPHLQYHLYPFIYIACAAFLLSLKKFPAAGAFRILLAVPLLLQLWDLWLFFPNLLMVGGQYGNRFIGEFYGPAVLHGQDRAELTNLLVRLTSSRPDMRILKYGQIDFPPVRLISFLPDSPQTDIDYAFIDYRSQYHLNFRANKLYLEHVKRLCPELVYIKYFPPGIPAYELWKCVRSP